MVSVKEKFEISDNEYYYTAGYYTANKWIDNNTIVVSRSKHPLIERSSGEKVELVKISLDTGEMTVLCDDVIGSAAYVVHKNIVYYSAGKEIKTINTLNGDIQALYKDEFFPNEKASLLMPEKTRDGRYISVFIENEGFPTYFVVINTETGEAKKLCEKNFSAPFSRANHGMICPTDPDIIFFAHEGDTRYVSNRLWIYNAKTDKMYNTAKQNLDEDGNLGDCFGHEMWASDGKGLYFVKYPVSPLPSRGICYVDIETKEVQMLYSSYKYWHVGTAENGRFLVADTQLPDWKSEVVVIDKEDGSETVVDSNLNIKEHPCHPHPQISPDNKTVVYTAFNDDGRVCIKGIFLE